MFCAMCASIAWYGAADNGSPELKLGPVKMSLAGIYVGLISSVMTFPITLLIVAIFRYSEPSPEHKKILENELSYGNLVNITDIEKDNADNADAEASNNVAENENKTDYSNKGLKHNSGIKEDMIVHQEGTEHGNDGGDGLVLVGKISLSTNQEKKKKCRPHWCRYIGFAFCFATVGVAFWATVEIAGVFGREKSLEWLISFFFSAFESIFISQPFKVGTAFLFHDYICHGFHSVIAHGFFYN